jgi:hypothetical protein
VGITRPGSAGVKPKLGGVPALHEPLVRLRETDLAIDVVCVSGVEQPLAEVGEWALVDREANKLEPQPASAIRSLDVHIGEIGNRVPVRDDPRIADEILAVVETDDARCGRDQLVGELAGNLGPPVRLIGEEPVHSDTIDAVDRIIELESIPELAPHGAILARRA